MATPAQFQAAPEPPKKCTTHGLSRSVESLHTGDHSPLALQRVSLRLSNPCPPGWDRSGERKTSMII